MVEFIVLISSLAQRPSKAGSKRISPFRLANAPGVNSMAKKASQSG